MGSFVPHILPAIGQFFGGIATGLGIGGGAAAGAAGAGVAAANAAAVAGAPSALGTIGALTAGGVGAMVGLPELTKLNLFSHTATTTTLAADHAAQNAITDHATQPTNAANMAKDAAQANVTTKAATDQLHSGNWFSNLFAAKNTVVASQLVDGAEASHTAAELGHHSVDEHAMHSVHHGHDAGTVDQNSAPDTPDRQDMDAFKWRRKTGNNMSMANGSFADAVGGSQQNKLAAITQRPKASFADSLNEDRAKLDTLIGPA